MPGVLNEYKPRPVGEVDGTISDMDEAVLRALRELPLYRSEAHACAYLAGRSAVELFTLAPPRRVTAAMYQMMMDHGFRRAGAVIYKPICPGCSECRPIRVPVAQFRPSRSQRRVIRRNADLRVEIGPPRSDDARYALYRRYQEERHRDRVNSREAFERFLVNSPIDTLEMAFFAEARLLAVSIIDIGSTAFSSVYFYFDPAESRRSLGVFSALNEIEECRRRGVPYWYIGFHVKGCARMEYKARFQPAELLGVDGVWRLMADEAPDRE